MRFLLLLLTFLLSLPALAQETPHVTLRLFADHDAAVPGQTLRLAVEQQIAAGWHTYWINPGDSGEPMRIKWALPEDYTISSMLWPAPERVPYGPLMNFGYTDRAVMLADLGVPANAKPGAMLAIRGAVTVLVCDEICIPESKEIALDIPVASSANTANSDIFTAAGKRLPQPVDWTTVSELDANEVRVRITLPSYAARIAAVPEDITWFPAEWGYIENASDQFANYEPSTGTLTLRQKRSDERDVTALKSASYLIRSGDEAYIVNGSISQAAPPVIGEGIRLPATTADISFLTVLALAFIGGMILNLMPCVFPILSIKALHLVSLPKSERRHAQLSGALYGAGVISMFVILGAVLFAVRAAGAQMGWGFQLQNPAVVAALAWLMFVVGLNLAGVFDLRIAFGGEVLLAEKHHPLVTSFLMGVLATLVATPCSAPFMATAVGVAMTQSMGSALVVFAFVGLGLAFPFVLLCILPQAQKILPRPGAWMEIFRQILAFPMFASAVWLVWVVAQQGGPGAVGWTLAGMVALAFAIWLLDRQPTRRAGRSMVMIAGIAVIGFTLAGLALVVPTPDENSPEVIARARDFNTEDFENALTESDAPVFVNMSASWCITCLMNEQTTLDTPDLRELFREKNVTYFRGDWTNSDPDITKFLQQFGRSGVPIYVFYGAPDASGTRPPPVVLPQILSFDTLQGLFE